MFEHHTDNLLPWGLFLRRMGRYGLIALILVGISWLIGILGYRILENMAWIDAILNSAMLLGGMGPVDQLHTNAGKIFASFYALFSGLVFLVTAGILAAPVLHRFLHQFHLAEEDDDDGDENDSSPKT